ncbi:hypothetical protein [Flavobacterium sp. N2820]|jgi:hypothetical protein|uniref:hypothetical protein n=1 Tax=Flavobacterium sp. N2820 TaxID=2986834 RepID=UPI002224ACE0|nr:hypothetical protein [Flavobacterium sp. N2820]
MAGEGAMMQAIKSLAYNKSLRGNRNRTSWKEYKNQNNKPLEDHIKATPELLKEISTRLQAENKKRKKQQIIFVTSMVIVLIFMMYYFN